MRRDPMYLTAAGGRPDGLRRLAQPRWPLLWLAVALGSALFLAVALAQAVRAAGEAIQLGATTLSVDEGHSTSYSVFLAGDQPSSDVVVDITSSNSDVKPSPKFLTFTPANYRTSQPVTLRAADDVDSRNERATITHAINVTSSADSFDEVADVTLTVNVMDDDAVGTTFSSGEGDDAFDPTTEPVKVDEGRDAEYTVELQSAPTSEVTVTLTSSNEAAVTVSPATITLKSTDFDAEIVKVTGVDDATTNDETVTITHAFASTDDDYDGRSEVVTVEVSDDETAGVTFAPSPLKLDIEEGGSTAYIVSLAAEPTHDVTVRISSDNGDVSPLGNPLTGRTLMFTPDNWNDKQTVTVEVGSDDDAADESATITHAVSSADANYNSAAIIKAAVAALDANDANDAKATDVQKAAARDSLKGTVTVTDVNVGVRISHATVEVDEGRDAEYTVELQSAPTHDVTVAISSDNTDVTVSPAELSFTTDNWADKQRVEVKAAQEAADAEDRSDESAALKHAISSDDPRYDDLLDQTVTANVTDDDPSVTLSASEVEVVEGESGSFTVKLAVQPDSDPDADPDVKVTITVASDSDDVTVSPAELSFTTDDWDMAQTVTVTVVPDEDDRDGTATVTLTVAAADPKDSSEVYIAEFIQTVSILLTEPQVVVEVRGPTVTVPGPTRTKTVTETVTVEVEVPAVPNVVGGTSAATATEVNGQVVITRHDGGASLVVNIGGFIRDESLGQTYQVVRRMDGMIVRQWVSPNSPLVYQIPWAVVNSQFSVPVGVIGAIPLDDQSGAAGQLVRRFDGGDDRIFSYDGMGGWRHVPDIPTFQALGLYWCDVTAADAGFFDRITIGSPHAATDMPARDDYPTCSTG